MKTRTKTWEGNAVGIGERGKGEGKMGQAGVDAEGWERRWRLFGTVIM